MREKRRYLLLRVEPAGIEIDQKDLYYAVSDAVTTLWGDTVAAVITAAVVAAENGHVFIRCSRGSERELMIALSTVTGYRDVRLALRMVAVSGTMESLRARVRKQKPSPSLPEPTPEPESPPMDSEEPAEVSFSGKKLIVLECEGAKVDVIEKGFKNTNRLFLTSEDLEES
jgi:ribonuclease P/MRP protein subunit POP5